jgi:putative cardiolipin synthase
MRVSLRVAAATAALLLSACAQLPERPQLSVDQSLAVAGDTVLDEVVGSAEARHPGESGFRLLSAGTEAFALRAHSAKIAGRSLDVQTYIWHPDLTGRHLAYLLLSAADRGVQVRVLVDDMDARGINFGFAALDAHPNIEVRMFNPLPSRSGMFAMIGDLLADSKRLNHRMHNKTWIADNRIAVVGGRNLGDEYFGASEEVNFVDLDFAMVGPVVRDASASFDKYWNSRATYPILLLSPEGVTEEALGRLRERLNDSDGEARASPYAELLSRDDSVRRLVSGDWLMEWSGNYSFISDDPLKALREPGQESDVLGTLVPVLGDTEQALTIISPYFVPGKQGTQSLVELAKSGTQVMILTNSLAANDVAAVHGGYSQYRKDLLNGGVSLWELKPLPGSGNHSSFFGSSGASLHTKALAVDARALFVGSYNLDPRSTSLNCEQGVLVYDESLTQQFLRIFDQQSAGERAWKVTLQQGDLHWSDGAETFDSEPQASAGRRFQAWLARVFPIESQL